MTDAEIPEEEPVEEPLAEEPLLDDELETVELVDVPVELSGRVRWEDEDGNEFFAGPGETVPENAEPV